MGNYKGSEDYNFGREEIEPIDLLFPVYGAIRYCRRNNNQISLGAAFILGMTNAVMIGLPLMLTLEETGLLELIRESF